MASMSNPSGEFAEPGSPVLREPEPMASSRFDALAARLRGTVTVRGEVVTTDGEPWACEGE